MGPLFEQGSAYGIRQRLFPSVSLRLRGAIFLASSFFAYLSVSQSFLELLHGATLDFNTTPLTSTIERESA
jgi:hypothetical protein